MSATTNALSSTLFGEVILPQGAGTNFTLPGPTYESAKITQKVLQDNHVLFHCFFNDSGFHNHLSHHVLALYSLGASAERIREAYDTESSYQRPMLPLAPDAITESNWTSHLNDEAYYPNYLAFFTSQLKEHGTNKTLDKFLFKSGEGDMLVRSMAGIIHPFIQWGYGVEFGLDALLAEGLAQAAVHDTTPSPLFPPDFIASAPKGLATAVGEKFNLVGSQKVNFHLMAAARACVRERKPKKGLSSFEILNNILADPSLAAGQAMQQDDFPRFGKAVQNRGTEIVKHCEEWVFDESGGWEEVVDKTEELFWLATVIYAAATRPGYKPYKMDFFTMHALTSVLFLPPTLEALSPQYRPLLLHAHFRTMIGYWISRGRPKPYIEEVLMKHTSSPGPPNKLGPASHSPWTEIIAAAITHPDEHVLKTIRSLAYAASLFGCSPPGIFKCSLPGTDTMDGTLFVRAAGMTLDALDWIRSTEAKEHGKWDRSVLGFDVIWV